MPDHTPKVAPTRTPTISELSTRLFHLSDSLDLVAGYNENSETGISAFLRLMALDAADCAEALSHQESLMEAE